MRVIIAKYSLPVIYLLVFLCDIINYTKTKSGVDADKLD